MSKTTAKPPPASTGTDLAAPAGDTLTVHFSAPGVKRIGPYKPNTAYTLPRAEAERLVRAKGFTLGEPPAPPASKEG